MSVYNKLITKEKTPKLKSLKDDITQRRDKDFFWPSGTQVYVGRQGSGKTISAVKHLLDLHETYPKAIIVTNIALSFGEAKHFNNKMELDKICEHLDTTKEYIAFQSIEQLSIALVGVNNSYYGVIYVVDEIHTYFNALESKNIPMYVFTEISQQRKQRKLIVGTSQLFLRMAKPLREQCDNLIICNTIFGFITTQRSYDGMSLTQDYDGSMQGTVRRFGWFYHTPKIRNSFDTFQKVVSGAEQYEEVTRVEIKTTKKGLKLK